MSSATAAPIFMAEDNPADVYLIRLALTEHGVENPLEIANDGQEAWAYFRKTAAQPDIVPPGLIVLDLNLPKYDGLELLCFLRDNPRLRDVPIVVLTSSNSPADRQAVMNLGAVQYLCKPSSLPEYMALGGVLRNLLGQTQATTHGT